MPGNICDTPTGTVYRFRTRYTVCDLRFGGMSVMGA